jgi:predicted MPP superfamily phosphohydrolase
MCAILKQLATKISFRNYTNGIQRIKLSASATTHRHDYYHRRNQQRYYYRQRPIQIHHIDSLHTISHRKKNYFLENSKPVFCVLILCASCF